jgi:hypothetical protein
MSVRKGLLGLAIISALFIATFGSAAAVTLDLGDAVAVRGSSVEIALSLDSEGRSVASTSNDILYDPALLSNPRARIDGSIGIDSEVGKQVIYNVLEGGVLRVAVLGLNREAIPDGVIAWVSFDVAADAEEGSAVLLENNPSASDVDGNNLSTDGSNGSIYISGSGDTVSATPADDTPVAITVSPSSGEVSSPIDLVIKVSETTSIENFMEDGFSIFLNGEDITSFLLNSGTVALDAEKGEATLVVNDLTLPDGEYELNAYLGNLSGFIGHASVKYSVQSD